MAPNMFFSVLEMDLFSVSAPTDKLPPPFELEEDRVLILSLGRASRHFWYRSLHAASIVYVYLIEEKKMKRNFIGV